MVLASYSVSQFDSVFIIEVKTIQVFDISLILLENMRSLNFVIAFHPLTLEIFSASTSTRPTASPTIPFHPLRPPGAPSGGIVGTQCLGLGETCFDDPSEDRDPRHRARLPWVLRLGGLSCRSVTARSPNNTSSETIGHDRAAASREPDVISVKSASKNQETICDPERVLAVSHRFVFATGTSSIILFTSVVLEIFKLVIYIEQEYFSIIHYFVPLLPPLT